MVLRGSLEHSGAPKANPKQLHGNPQAQKQLYMISNVTPFLLHCTIQKRLLVWLQLCCGLTSRGTIQVGWVSSPPKGNKTMEFLFTQWDMSKTLSTALKLPPLVCTYREKNLLVNEIRAVLVIQRMARCLHKLLINQLQIKFLFKFNLREKDLRPLAALILFFHV